MTEEHAYIAASSAHLESQGMFEQYMNLLRKWNKTINLVAASTIDELWQRHIQDSAQLYSHVPSTCKQVTDFGSGAGLPVVVLAIMAQAEGRVTHFHAIESVRKKATFLQQMVLELGLKNLTIHHGRAEDINHWKSDVITARAFAPLPELLAFTQHFSQKECLFLLLKGCKVEAEIREAKNAGWKFASALYPSKTADGFILTLKEVETPYPRSAL